MTRCAHNPSCPDLARASTSFFAAAKTWMAGTSPAMTESVWDLAKDRLGRRDFITLVTGAAAAWPLAARAQQTKLPVVGFLDAGSAAERTPQVAAFRKGLAETGYHEGQNVVLEFRWAEGQYGRFAELAADLVRRGVSVIAVPGSGAGALAAKAATTMIPIVFGTASDPVKEGLVASLNRPGGNATGVNFFSVELVAKRMQLLRELVPAAQRIALLVNPTDQENYQSNLRDVQAAASGQQILALEVATGRDIDAAFASMAREKPDALFVAPGTFFNTRRVQLAILAARYAVPAAYSVRAYPEVGGLMSYGTDILDAFRQVGVYAGRILKGAKPADLPVVQSTKFELVINLNTARALGLDVPANLLALADEVIE
jgi:putative ABC transport system substrate-binding protein